MLKTLNRAIGIAVKHYAKGLQKTVIPRQIDLAQAQQQDTY
jgi:hypothetical protein